MLLRNAWYIGAWADEIDGERPLARPICNDPIVLFRGGMGRVAALADRCSHRAAPLHIYGHRGGRDFQCGYHGLVINGSGLRECTWEAEDPRRRAGAQATQ